MPELTRQRTASGGRFSDEHRIPNTEHAEIRTTREEPAYYDISMLKPPVWGWEVAGYFFLGGLSAGAYLIARMADRFGGERFRPVVRAGTAAAAVAVVPCAPLLIADLGDPSRFHHMLRVFKPRSPMNLGAWTLTAYSGAVAAAVLREWLRGDVRDEDRALADKVLDGVLVAVTDAAGVPLALLLAGYTGVLLSATATPIWSKNPWLGPLFSASAISSGAGAVKLALELMGSEQVGRPVDAVHTIAHVAEAVTLAGFLSAAGKLGKPLVEGAEAKYLWGGALAAVGSEVLARFSGRTSGIGSSLLGLASGLALRWAFVQAGPPSANDPDAARRASRPRHCGAGVPPAREAGGTPAPQHN
jgi:formate-dependent nitrite reductase membrane component NrfD